MPIWKNRNRRTLGLEIVGYQFPDIGEDWDANWLVVESVVTRGQRSWTTRDPSLLTWELGSIVRWLEAIRDGVVERDELGFLEPYLSFRYHGPVKSRHRLEVNISMLALAPDDRVCHVVDLTEPELDASIAELRASLERFPPRGALGQQQSPKR